ncbi:MAG: hypothetical protein KA792_00095 [Bacteroidales bacterium]|nr:hypothetical protein [Bacteroidales bacterium]
MNIFRSFEELGKGINIRKPVVTTGSFDGVHIGHKAILRRMRILADDIGGETALITFHPHPRKILYPDSVGKDLFLINSQREKIDLLRKVGLDNLFIIPFTLEFSRTTSAVFVKKILIEKINSKIIIVGFNHHFGYNREGDYKYLYELSRENAFAVEEIPEQDLENEAVSSTKIRKALLEGDIQKANAYLDHHYIIYSKLFRGSRLLQDLNLNTYNLFIEEDIKLIPPAGVYAVNCNIDKLNHKALLNIKIDENNKKKYLEIYLIDAIEDHSNKQVVISFAKRLRDEYAFSNKDELLRRLNADIEIVNNMIF